MSIFFRVDQKAVLYKREDYDLLEFFGDLGGLLDFVLLTGYIVVHAFIARLYSAALISETYRM